MPHRDHCSALLKGGYNASLAYGGSCRKGEGSTLGLHSAQRHTSAMRELWERSSSATSTFSSLLLRPPHRLCLPPSFHSSGEKGPVPTAPCQQRHCCSFTCTTADFLIAQKRHHFPWLQGGKGGREGAWPFLGTGGAADATQSRHWHSPGFPVTGEGKITSLPHRYKQWGKKHITKMHRASPTKHATQSPTKRSCSQVYAHICSPLSISQITYTQRENVSLAHTHSLGTAARAHAWLEH